MDITELLERAVADVVPAERRPTDAVLALAEKRDLWARLRKALAGLAGVAVIGGGAAVVATAGNDGDDGQTRTPKPFQLTVDVPADWTAVDTTVVVDCESTLQARTVYRDAVFGDTASCGAEGPNVTGPVLLIGQLKPEVAEQIRAVGSPVTAGKVPGYVVGYDAVSSFIVWVPAGSHGDRAYAAVAPRSEDDQPAFESIYAQNVGSLPAELVDLVGTVEAKGDLDADIVLPDDVAAVDMPTEWVNVDPAPGARVTEPSAVADVMAELDMPRDGGAPGFCGTPVSGRVLYLEDAETHRWVRVDVLDDDAGCRTAVSELGGRRVISGDPVGAATAAAEPQTATVGDAAETVTTAGLNVAVPEGWTVVRGDRVDPCTLPGPAVVVADELTPSCYAAFAARPTHPFAWLTSQQLEGGVVGPLDRESLRTPQLPVTWSHGLFEVGDIAMDGIVGVPPAGSGRVLVVGLDAEESLPLRQSVSVP